MSARILGSIDIVGGILLLVARNHYPTFGALFLIIGILLIGKGLMSML